MNYKIGSIIVMSNPSGLLVTVEVTSIGDKLDSPIFHGIVTHCENIPRLVGQTVRGWDSQIISVSPPKGDHPTPHRPLEMK